MDDYATLQGDAVSWADISLSIVTADGPSVLAMDIADLSWNSTRSRGTQLRSGRKYARTRGATDHTASMTLYHSGWVALRRALVEAAQARGLITGGMVMIGDVHFDVVAKWTPLGSDDINIVEIRKCVIDDLGEFLAEGDDPDQVPITLNPMQIVMIDNGVEVALG